MDAPFVAVAGVDEIPAGGLKRVTVDGHAFLIANVDGDYYAVDDTCRHEDFSLSYGCIEGDRIKCSLHGSRFCLKTGVPQEEPAAEPIGTYRVRIAQGRVWIDPSGRTN